LKVKTFDSKNQPPLPCELPPIPENVIENTAPNKIDVDEIIAEINRLVKHKASGPSSLAAAHL